VSITNCNAGKKGENETRAPLAGSRNWAADTEEKRGTPVRGALGKS